MPLPSYIQNLTTPLPNVRLWQVSLDVDVGKHDLALLSKAEQARATGFRFERDARRYRVSHVALRLILAQALEMADPAQLAWQHNAHGKPQLASDALHFNMSHSGDWALIGLCPAQPIGVDLEMLAPMDDADSLAQRHFTAAEYATYVASPESQRHAMFLQGWTRKEACLKALGSGLSIEPNSFEVGIHADTQTCAIATPEGASQVEVVSLTWPSDSAAALGGHVAMAAVAVLRAM